MRHRVTEFESWGDVGVRPATLDDLDAVVSLETAPDNARWVAAWSKERHAAAIADGDADHLVLIRGSAVVGYVILRGVAAGRIVELLRIVVRDKGQGTGSRTLARIVDYAFERLGARRLWLDVVESNTRARRIYERAGFRVEGVLRDAMEREGGFDSLVVMSMLRSEWRPAA